MSASIPTLSEAFGPVEDLYVNAEYRELPDWRFLHDALPHRHDALAASLHSSAQALPIRHWTIQDVYDSDHLNRMLNLAAQYGMTGIQFSGDNIYWVNDALHRYNSYVFLGELCERCHDRGLKAYFWTHEINGFFHEFVRDGRYGFSGQLAGGKIDLSSNSRFWQVLYEKYDVFFRRLRGVDGLVLTLNESQIPVFRDECILSDLDAGQRVARIGRTVKQACDAHGKHLILRTFCYTPEETENIRRGVEAIGRDVTLMIKCVPHDWQTFFPHDPLIAALKDFPRIIEFDLAHEPMGAGRFPYPDVEHIAHRMEHAMAQGAMGVAGRIDRFRNHAHGTLNWANVFALSRLAREPGIPADRLWRQYAAADVGDAHAPFIANFGQRLYRAGQQTYFLGKEWGSLHSNFNRFASLAQGRGATRALWSPQDAEACQTLDLLREPTPMFIEQIAADKQTALEDLRQLQRELVHYQEKLPPAVAEYLSNVLARSIVLADAFASQHRVMLMTRHDAVRPAHERIYGARIDSELAHLRHLVQTQRNILLEGGNEGCQYGPQLLEEFCRNVSRHLDRRDETPGPQRVSVASLNA